MNQRNALLIAAALTAFLLVLAGGLASRLSSTVGAADVTPTNISTLEPSPQISLDPSVEALIQEREAAYQQALDEANARLEAANAQIAQANAQIGSLEQSRPTTVAPKLMSQDQAIQSAQAYIGGGDVQSVELQHDQGAQTYVVIFSDGSKIYVDALNGYVVYAAIRTPPALPAPQYGDDDDHDGDRDHHDD